MIFEGQARIVALDADGNEAPIWGPGSELHSRALDEVGPVEVGQMVGRLTVEVSRVYRTIHHALWLIMMDSALRAVGWTPSLMRELPASTLRRCRCCGCVLDNPADWPASISRGLGCAWCRAVLFDDEDAAELIWGIDEVMRAIDWAENFGGPAFPPRGMYRRPVTAPTLGCYR